MAKQTSFYRTKKNQPGANNSNTTMAELVDEAFLAYITQARACAGRASSFAR